LAAQGDVVLQDAPTNQTISLNGPNALTFTVASVVEGSGDFAITLELPEGHGIISATVFIDGVPQTGAVTPSGNTLVFAQSNYPVGNYLVSIHLFKDAIRYGVVSELVQVRNTMSSTKTIALQLTDLNVTYLITYVLNEGTLNALYPGSYQLVSNSITLPLSTRNGYTVDDHRLRHHLRPSQRNQCRREPRDVYRRKRGYNA
jgi:hypothetical protein